MCVMKKGLALLLAGVLSVGLVGCGGGSKGENGTSSGTATQSSASSKTDKDTLVILGSENWQSTLSPLNHTSTCMLHAEALSLDHLLKMDEEKQEPQPWLITEWSYDDTQTVLTCKVKEGVKFHDGTDFTAEDAAASCEAYSSSDNVSGSWWADSLECEVIDDYTFTITPSSGKPLGSLVNMLCSTPAMSADDLASPETTLDVRYNGTGPYKFVKLENDCAYYDVNEDYWAGAYAMKHVQYKYVADSTTRLNALMAGEADIIERADSDTVDTLKSDGNCEVVTLLTTEIKHLIPKFEVEPMNEKLVRKAIAYAIDYDGIVNDILNGYAEKTDSFISSTIWGYSSVEGVGEYNVEKAKELLKEAGYENGQGLSDLTIYTSVGFYPKTKEYYEYICANLQAIGINCTCVPIDTSAWSDLLYEAVPTDSNGTCYMIDCGWQPSGIEPELKLNSWYAEGRISHYQPTAELQDIMSRFAIETDADARKKILQEEYLPALAEEMPDIPLFKSMAIYGVRKNVKGLAFTSGADFDLSNVTKE